MKAWTVYFLHNSLDLIPLKLTADQKSVSDCILEFFLKLTFDDSENTFSKPAMMGTVQRIFSPGRQFMVDIDNETHSFHSGYFLCLSGNTNEGQVQVWYLTEYTLPPTEQCYTSKALAH
jgi:hypothetical protein